MPDDDTSHWLLEVWLQKKGVSSWQFEPVFLRWDSRNSTTGVLVKGDREISTQSLEHIVRIAFDKAEKSSDWWRHIGAVLFDYEGTVIESAHNIHLPTEYTPYIDGDPRAAFSRGVNIELSTSIHAESAVIAEAASKGIATKGLRLFVTTFPCPVCAKLIAACGISELYFVDGYSMVDGEAVLRNAGVAIIRVV